jgi:cell division transport system permease protein
MAKPRSLRPSGFDDLGLRRALGDRMLPVLVAAMAFLAALALAGSAGAAALVRHWQEGAAAALTVQVPSPSAPLPRVADGPEETRLDRALSTLRATPGVLLARPLSDAELADLLRPWLGSSGDNLSLPLPAVVQVRLSGAGPDLATLQAKLEAAAPGTLVESHGAWVQRLAVLARSLQACAWLALAVVAAVAAAVIMVATRAGLSARRDSIEIVHGLGATDGYIAGRFAARATALAALGALCGAIAAVPVLLALAALAAPFVAAPVEAPTAAATAVAHGPLVQNLTAMLLAAVQTLPPELLIGLPALPVAAAVIGLLTAQGTVRRWLRRLP